MNVEKSRERRQCLHRNMIGYGWLCLLLVHEINGNRLKKLCDGWVGSPAMLRALLVRRVL